DLHHLLAGKTAAGGELGDRFEVMILPTRQAPGQHASRGAADVLEAVHDVARNEDDAAGTGLGGLIGDGHLIEALDDEQNLFLFEMDMVGWAFAGLVPRHDDRGDAAGGLRGEEHIHVEAERLDRQRLFRRNDSAGCSGVRASMYAVSSSSRPSNSTRLASPDAKCRQNALKWRRGFAALNSSSELRVTFTDSRGSLVHSRGRNLWSLEKVTLD